MLPSFCSQLIQLQTANDICLVFPGSYAWEAGQYPIWNEEFVFDGVDCSAGSTLQFALCHADRRGNVQSTIGEANLCVSDLLQMRRFVGNLKLFSGSSMHPFTNRLSDDGYRGNRKNVSSSCESIVAVDIQVVGNYSKGEEEFLSALQVMGFETLYSKLKANGFQTIADLCKVDLFYKQISKQFIVCSLLTSVTGTG